MRKFLQDFEAQAMKDNAIGMTAVAIIGGAFDKKEEKQQRV